MSDAAVLYLDSSALVKLYVTEPGTDNVRTWLAAAAAACTSRIARMEVAAAVARRTREQVLRDFEATAIREAPERAPSAHSRKTCGAVSFTLEGRR